MELDPATDKAEYDFVAARFQEGGVGADGTGTPPLGEFTNSIIKIERVQNSLLWESYYSNRALVAKRNGGNANEKCDSVSASKN